MNMRQGEAVFANFICTFGDKEFLLDYLAEIVIPSLTEKQQTREWGTTKYYLLDGGTEILQIDGIDRPILFGRFVKDTILKRDQVLNPDMALVKDRQAI